MCVLTWLIQFNFGVDLEFEFRGCFIIKKVTRAIQVNSDLVALG